MLIEILQPVLVGNRVHEPGDEVDVDPVVGKRLVREQAAKVLRDETMPMLTLQSLQGQSGPSADHTQTPAGTLALEQMVAIGIPPKVAKILMDAGIQSREQLTMETLTAIEGIGEKTAEMVVTLINKGN